MPGLRPMVQSLILATVIGLAGPVPGARAAPEPMLVRLGTASITGVYFPVGIALCRIVNQHRPETGLRCSATLTAGSVANATGLESGTLDLALLQSDTQADAVAGQGPFAEAGGNADLRAVFALYPEALALVTRRDSGIKRPEDLPGKRVWRGAETSGTRILAGALEDAYGIAPESFAPVPDIASDQVADALCRGDLDAFFYAAGQPTPAITEAALSCGITLVPITGPRVDALVAGKPAFVTAIVPGGLYPGVPTDTPTFGVGATLVTRADAPEEQVHRMVSEIFADFNMLRGLEPVLARLDPKEMVTSGLTAPLHPGAERYYRERGWLP